MFFSRLITAFVLLFLSAISFGQPASPANVLLVHSNAPIEFTKVNAATVQAAVTKVMSMSDALVKKIISIPAGTKTSSNTLMVVDELQYELSDLGMKLGLILSAYPSDSVRNAANFGAELLSGYSANLFLNEPLYQAIKQYASTTDAQQLHENQKKYLSEVIRGFENNGMKLDAAGKKKLQAINEKIIGLGIQFDKNLADARDSILFTG